MCAKGVCIKTPSSSITSATLTVASQITESKLLRNYMLKVRQLLPCSLFCGNSCVITCKLVLGLLSLTYEWRAKVTKGQFYPQSTHSTIRNNKDSCTEDDRAGFLILKSFLKDKIRSGV